MFEQARISENETDFMMKFHTSKITYEHLKHVNFSRKRIMISPKKDPILTEIVDMTALSDVHHTESSRQLYFDVRTVEMSLIKEFSIDGDVVCDGIFLSNGTFVIADYRDDGKCMFFDKHWVPSIFGESLKKPFGLIENDEEVLVTCSGSKSIEVFSSSDLQKLRSIPMTESVSGITHRRGDIYVACGKKIIKIDSVGRILKIYDVEGANNVNILATNTGLIVYSDWKIEKVTAITDQGDIVWKYKNRNLKCPSGIDQDSVGNIYVTGRDSNNVHVLSGTGELIRVFEDIPSPTFFKLIEERGIICAFDISKRIRVFEV
ncbi:uncharacterized protein LOC125662085 [Ostrea edulis]|uniref:uncharacterized protein LOC125662085 n=1 Tax=Ostrea edulis TaxID=37623 RepID=UPI0024AECF8F|nr:uncharacterized protein LOC125662085 [Ostrea edulis]